jgi:hypothetical protein
MNRSNDLVCLEAKAEVRTMTKVAVASLLLCTFVWPQSDQSTNKTRDDATASTQTDKSSSNQSELQAATETVQRMSSAAGDQGIPNSVLQGRKMRRCDSQAGERSVRHWWRTWDGSGDLPPA